MTRFQSKRKCIKRKPLLSNTTSSFLDDDSHYHSDKENKCAEPNAAPKSHNISIDSESSNKEPVLPSFTAIHLSSSTLNIPTTTGTPCSPALSIISDISSTSNDALISRINGGNDTPLTNGNVSNNSPSVTEYLKDSPQTTSSFLNGSSSLNQKYENDTSDIERNDIESPHGPERSDKSDRSPLSEEEDDGTSEEEESVAPPRPKKLIRRKRKRVPLNHAMNSEDTQTASDEENMVAADCATTESRLRSRKRRHVASSNNRGTMESEIIQLGAHSAHPPQATPDSSKQIPRDTPSSAESSYSFGSSPFVNTSPNANEVGALRKRLIFKSPSVQKRGTRSQSRSKYHCHQSSSLTLTSGGATPRKEGKKDQSSNALCQMCGLDMGSDNHSSFCNRLRRSMKLSDSVLQSMGILREDLLDQCSIPSLKLYELNVKKRKAVNIFDIISDLLLFAEEESVEVENFKLFVCLDHDLVVGAVIVEQISSAFKTKPTVRQSPSKRSQKDVFEYDSTKQVKAVLGISRIWVDERYRRSSIASHLVDCARKFAIGGFECPRDSIAFTQPTEAGKRFAMRYCEGFSHEPSPFLVYKVSMDDNDGEG